MATFYTILTDVGQAKLANAIALGQTIDITELAVGDGNGSLPTPETSRTALVNEVRRAPINLSEVDDQNPNWVVVEQVLPPDVGGWTIREIGVFDVDGDLIGYGNYPETYKPVLAEGSSRTQTIRFVMEVSDTNAITLTVDPSVVLATRGYADDLIADHEASRNHPSATATDQGMVRLATPQRVRQFSDTDSVTAAALRDSGLLGGALSVITTADSPKSVTASMAGLLVVDAASGPVSVNLPAAAGNGAVRYFIVRIDSSNNAVTINPSGNDLIEFSPSRSLSNNGRLNLFSDGIGTWFETVRFADDQEAQALSSPEVVLSPASMKTAFQGNNQSLSSSGYQKLPGGIVFQWVTVSWNDIATSTEITVTYPISFENYVLYIGAVADTSQNSVNVTVNNVGLTSGKIVFKEGDTAPQGGSAKVLIIGY